MLWSSSLTLVCPFPQVRICVCQPQCQGDMRVWRIIHHRCQVCHGLMASSSVCCGAIACPLPWGVCKIERSWRLQSVVGLATIALGLGTVCKRNLHGHAQAAMLPCTPQTPAPVQALTRRAPAHRSPSSASSSSGARQRCSVPRQPVNRRRPRVTAVPRWQTQLARSSSPGPGVITLRG